MYKKRTYSHCAMEETQPTERQNILWSIILELYDEELTARMIGIRLNKPGESMKDLSRS